MSEPLTEDLDDDPGYFAFMVGSIERLLQSGFITDERAKNYWERTLDNFKALQREMS